MDSFSIVEHEIIVSYHMHIGLAIEQYQDTMKEVV